MRIAATFLITATILLSITAPTGCLAPSLPPKDVPDVHATEIVDECIFNKPRAKDRYLHRWFNITTGPIVEISGDRRAISYHRGYGVDLLFQDKAAAQSINLNDQVTAQCWLQHLSPGSLFFNHCTLAANSSKR